MYKALTPSTLAWLRSFDAAARHGSFTQAARELCITQGAVSQQVKQLELTLGFPLLVRQPGQLLLTREGKDLAPALERAFNLIRNALEEIDALDRPMGITLSCSPSFAIRWLTPRLNHLQADHPQIDVQLYGEFHKLNRSQMMNEGLEAAIRYDTGSYTNLAAACFLEEYLLPVASPEFVAVHTAMLAGGPAALDPALLLHDARAWDGVGDDEEWRIWLRGADVVIPSLSTGKRFNLAQLALGAALEGEGIAMGRLALVYEDLKAGRLVDLFGTAVRSTASYHFLSAAERSPRVTTIMNWLEAEATQFRAEVAPVLAGMTIIG